MVGDLNSGILGSDVVRVAYPHPGALLSVPVAPWLVVCDIEDRGLDAIRIQCIPVLSPRAFAT